MIQIKDLTGKKFNRLTVVRYSHCIKTGKNKKHYWLCKCSCGGEKTTQGHTLKCGDAQSCGCLHRENTRKLQHRIYLTHGKSKTKLYQIWKNMDTRCNHKHNKNYPQYGGRGITCNWDTYEKFEKDMNESYLESVAIHGTQNTTIDRIDVNGNYCKENCRWATRYEQSINRRNSNMVTIDEITKNISVWASELGISTNSFQYRLKNKWEKEDLLHKGKFLANMYTKRKKI